MKIIAVKFGRHGQILQVILILFLFVLSLIKGIITYERNKGARVYLLMNLSTRVIRVFYGLDMFKSQLINGWSR